MSDVEPCPAATGIITDGPHDGQPHRCDKPATHITRAPRTADHACACGKEWTSGPTVAEQVASLERQRHQHEDELFALRHQFRTSAAARGWIYPEPQP